MINAYRFRENLWNSIPNRHLLNSTGVLERSLEQATGYGYRHISTPLDKNPDFVHVTWACAVLNALYACGAREL